MESNAVSRDCNCKANGCPCRQQIGRELDDVVTGAAHSRVLQRLKLNNQVALVTGASYCTI